MKPNDVHTLTTLPGLGVDILMVLMDTNLSAWNLQATLKATTHRAYHFKR